MQSHTKLSVLFDGYYFPVCMITKYIMIYLKLDLQIDRKNV